MEGELTSILLEKSIHEIGQEIYSLDHLESYNDGDIDFYTQTFGKQILALKGKMLDVASGKGVFVRQMRARGKDIIGVDKNPDDLSVGGAAERLPFSPETFDVVFLHRLFPNYLAFVKDHKVVLKDFERFALHIILQIHTVLKESGTGFINVTAPLYINPKSGTLKMSEFAPKIAEEIFIDDLAEQLTVLHVPYDIQIQSIGETGNFSKIVANFIIRKEDQRMKDNLLKAQQLQGAIYRYFGIR